MTMLISDTVKTRKHVFLHVACFSTTLQNYTGSLRKTINVNDLWKTITTQLFFFFWCSFENCSCFLRLLKTNHIHITSESISSFSSKLYQSRDLWLSKNRKLTYCCLSLKFVETTQN